LQNLKLSLNAREASSWPETRFAFLLRDQALQHAVAHVLPLPMRFGKQYLTWECLLFTEFSEKACDQTGRAQKNCLGLGEFTMMGLCRKYYLKGLELGFELCIAICAWKWP